MKRYLIPLLSLSMLFAGCAQDDLIPTLDEIKVSSSYIVLDAAGGSKEFILTTTGDWTITNIPEDGYNSSAWLTVDPISGPAADGVKVTLSALKAYEDLSAELHVNVGGATQIITVKQTLGGNLELTTVDDFMKNGVDGKTYTVQGFVGSITNTVYGNYYLNDGTYEDGKGLYVYGMLDAAGAEKNFLSLGIEEGDEIIITGPRKTYNSDIEIEKASLVKMVKKALLGATVKSYTQSSEAGTLAAPVVVKGDDVKAFVPEEVDWIRFSGVEDSGKDAKIILEYTANTSDAPRTADITVMSKKGEDESELTLTVKQLPVLPAVKKVVEIDFNVKEYVTVEGQIAALTTDGFILYDGNTAANVVNKVFVEMSGFDDSKYKVGYKMSVSGPSEKKYARNKIVPDTFKVIEETEDYKHPATVALNAGNANDVIKESPAKYGYYVVSGYVDPKGKVLIPGADCSVTAISPVDAVSLKEYTGKYVTVKGYYTDNNSKYSEIQMVLTEVKEGADAPGFFKLQSTSANLDWNEPSAELYVVSNKEWTAFIVDEPEGVSLSKTSGKGSASIDVEFAVKNNTYEKETVKVNVVSGEETLTFTVNRYGKTLEFKGEDREVSSEKQDVTVEFDASMFWKVAVNGGAVLDKAEGKGTDRVIVSLPANETDQPKIYTVTLSEDRVSAENGKTVTLTITQKAVSV